MLGMVTSERNVVKARFNLPIEVFKEELHETLLFVGPPRLVAA